MAEDPPYEGLEAFVAARGDALLRTAALLMGGRTAGEDLLQAGLERIMRRWHQIRGDPEGYLRRTLYHLAVDDWRRRSRRREVFADIEPPPQVDNHDAIHLRHLLLRALAELPPRQRAVLVLRHWEGMSEADAAAVLGCSVGTIKSTASRGLVRLRELTADWSAPAAEGSPIQPGARS